MQQDDSIIHSITQISFFFSQVYSEVLFCMAMPCMFDSIFFWMSCVIHDVASHALANTLI